MARRPMYENAHKRTVRDTKAERDLGYGKVRDYKNGKDVHVIWDFHPDATRDSMVMLKIGKEEVIIDSEQLFKFLRWV